MINLIADILTSAIPQYVFDLFKPRYAVVVENYTYPSFTSSDRKSRTCPVIMRVPYKRPLNMSYNDFYRVVKTNAGRDTLVFFGYRWTLWSIDGIGSCLDHNVKQATVV